MGIRHRIVLVLLSAILLGAAGGSAAVAAPAIDLDHPVGGRVTRGFAPPGERWGAGHRGVDLSAAAGEPVRASADGVISFRGTIAGRGVVAITHQPATRLRTTYEPVEAVVSAGQRVRRGQVIGRVQAVVDRHDGLHWGLIEGETYLDPLSHSRGAPAPVRPNQVRLLPAGATPRPVETDGAAWAEEAVVTPVPVGLPWLARGSTRPADGPVTSGFGMRLHPVLHVWKLHDGVDIGAPCGAPARSALAGTVLVAERHVAYGNRVIVDHGGTRTGYAHLAAVNVAVGQRVEAGQQVGLVGTTGWSTGCHLHVMAWREQTLVDPSWLVTPQ